MRQKVISLVLVLLAYQAQALDIEFSNPDGSSIHFDVQTAETKLERRKGLMFRKFLADYEGMLFLYAKPQAVRMWMKNTPISLDMVFIGENNLVQAIAENTAPFSTDVIGPHKDTKYVVEVKAGSCKDHGIAIGSVLNIHPSHNSYES